MVLKETATALNKPITTIFRKSLMASALWKTVTITAMDKKRNRQ